jgi:predicted DCC family thiol-disulfide oxidoreductase YuxK
MADSPNPILLYDGVCGLCNRMVQFILKRDAQDRFRFAALQSQFARELLLKHGRAFEELKSMCLVLHHGQPAECVLTHSTAAHAILRELSTFWRMVAALLVLVPRPIRDWSYDTVARYRYRIFGQYDTCPLPDPKVRHKFLDVA